MHQWALVPLDPSAHLGSWFLGKCSERRGRGFRGVNCSQCRDSRELQTVMVANQNHQSGDLEP
jgi:hypothetical protein